MYGEAAIIGLAGVEWAGATKLGSATGALLPVAAMENVEDGKLALQLDIVQWRSLALVGFCS
jgi:hypothetical protein